MANTRRDFIRSSLMAGGIGLPLADCLRLQAAGNHQQKDTAVIQIWLGGGHSQFETFDPKPEAPAEIRGPYGTTSTLFPGIQFCDMMPKTGQVLDRTAIIRSIAHDNNGHYVAAHWLSTGHISNTAPPTHPSSGSIASHLLGPRDPGMPGYVLLSEEQTRNPTIGAVMGPSFLGSANSPFTILQDPFKSQFHTAALNASTDNFRLADSLTIDRLQDRKSLLGELDSFDRQVERQRDLAGIDDFNQTAFDIVTSGRAREAFDLNREPKHVREMYGEHRWGQSALLARRLVEAGVTFVTINTAPDSLCWDWHLNIVDDKRPEDGSNGPSRGMNISGPPLDQMISALVTDLYDRGLDKKVMLLVWGEFGRTPRVNKTGGRDHWGALMSILMAGGGLKVGQVIGASNPKGEMPIDRPIHPVDVLATVYRHLGIDPTATTTNREGRPIHILPGGKPIAELI